MDRLLLIQAILYFFIFLFGLITSISSGIARYNFGGNCILYGTANVAANETAVIDPAHSSVCNFLPTGNLIVGVLFGFCAFCYHVYYLHRSKIINRAAYHMCLKALCFAAALATFVTLVAGGALTTGLAEWCGSVIDSAQKVNCSLLLTCSDTQSTAVNWTIAGSDNPVYPGDYFYEYSLAQVAVWVSLVFWIIQLILCIYRLYKKSKQQNTYQDPFTMDPMDTFS